LGGDGSIGIVGYGDMGTIRVVGTNQARSVIKGFFGISALGVIQILFVDYGTAFFALGIAFIVA
jgi:hypothetical protein